MQRIEFRPAHVVSDSAALAPCLVGGAGIGRLPDFIARDAVARGALVRLLPDYAGDRLEIHALYTSHRSLSAKVRVFIDSLIEHLAVERQAGHGDGLQTILRGAVMPDGHSRA